MNRSVSKGVMLEADNERLVSALCHVLPELKEDRELLQGFVDQLNSNHEIRTISPDSIEPLAEIIAFLIKAEMESRAQ